MNIHLVVVRPFGTYVKGALITDPQTITEILAGASASHVVRVLAAAPAPAPTPTPAPAVTSAHGG
jgi:hypothetical protein